MSVRTTAAVFQHSRATLGSRLVLLAIADASREDGRAWPRPSTLARQTLLSDRQVRRIITELCEMGELEVELPASRQYPPLYRVTLPGLESPDILSADVEELPDIFGKPRVKNVRFIGNRKGTEEQEGSAPSGASPSRAASNGNGSKPRPRDPIWDALCAIFGEAPTLRADRARWNDAAKQLRDGGATPNEMARRAQQFRRQWPHTRLTPHALVANWSVLTPETGADPPRRAYSPPVR